LENIRNLIASKTYHVRIELESSFIEYDSFYIDAESNGYQLKVGSKIKGDLYDSFPGYHNGLKFSTYDKYQGGSSSYCPTTHQSGWWYDYCYYVHLLTFNSVYGQWYDGSSFSKFYQNAKMFLRPSSFQLGEKEKPIF
jgi:hypothetical protein